MSLFRTSLLLVMAVCLGCSAQSTEPQIKQRIEHQIRTSFSVPPNVGISVGDRHSSEFPNYDAVTVTLGDGDHKQTFDFLLSKDSKTLVRLTKMDMTGDPYVELMKRIDVQGRPVRGSKDGKVTIVNYDDFQCPYCSRMHEVLTSDIVKSYGDRVRIIYKDFPLEQIHGWAVHAAVDANCLADQSADAFWDFADYVHANPREISGEKRAREEQLAALDRISMQQGQKRNVDVAKLQACMKAQDETKVRASMAEAAQLGVEATPTLFVNGERIPGALPPSMLHSVIDRALREAQGGTKAEVAGHAGTTAAK